MLLGVLHSLGVWGRRGGGGVTTLVVFPKKLFFGKEVLAHVTVGASSCLWAMLCRKIRAVRAREKDRMGRNIH